MKTIVILLLLCSVACGRYLRIEQPTTAPAAASPSVEVDRAARGRDYVKSTLDLVTLQPAQDRPGATKIAFLRIQGDTWASVKGCEDRLADRARELGADLLVLAPGEQNVMGYSCSGTAYKKTP